MSNTDNTNDLNKLINTVVDGKSAVMADEMLVSQLIEHGKGNIVSTYGSWNGEGETRDIEEDVINMIRKLGSTTMPKYLIIPESDEKFLYMLNCERETVISKVTRLFGRSKNDVSFIIKSKSMPVGMAAIYGVSKDFPNITSVVLINTRGNPLFTEYNELSKWVYEAYNVSED